MANSSATKILVVEDDEVAAEFAQMALQGAGYEVVVATDGNAGLEIAAEDEDIALVVLDIGLPDISGYEVAARIRTDPDLVDMPILMLTSKNSRQDKFSGLVLAEANAYLIKPTDPARLVATVEVLLRRKPEA
jgi:DNA-binding response OmpR family regulator